jgi:hypothetical protein
MTWLYGAPFVAASLHITEEFFLPGGFAEWDRKYRPALAASITSRFHVIINALLLILCFDVFALRRSATGTALWLFVAALLFSNALWHLRGAWKTRSYSPGMVTGTLLYVPMAAYGYFYFLSTRTATVPTAVIAFALGASYPLISTFMHRRRLKHAARTR